MRICDLVAGKKYQGLLSKTLYECVLVNTENNFAVTKDSAGTLRLHTMDPAFREYKEPKIHEKDLIWFRYPRSGEVLYAIYPTGFKLARDKIELHRQTVTYTEQPE